MGLSTASSGILGSGIAGGGGAVSQTNCTHRVGWLHIPTLLVYLVIAVKTIGQREDIVENSEGAKNCRPYCSVKILEFQVCFKMIR